MKKKYTISALFVGLILFVNYNVYGQCDTLRNYNPNDSYYQLTTDVGSILGIDEIDDGVDLYHTDIWVEPYSAQNPIQVTGVRMAPWQITDNTGSSVVKVQVYDDYFGEPGNVIAEQVVPYSSLTANAWNTVLFDVPVNVTGTFYVGYQIPVTSPFNDFALLGTTPVNTGYTITHLDGSGIYGGAWYTVSGLYIASGGGDLNVAFLLDVLTTSSIPVADFTVDNDIACLSGVFNVDASNSTFGTNYNWILTDDPITQLYVDFDGTAIDTLSATTSNPSNQLLHLWLDGACHSFDLMTIPVTILPDVAAVVSTTPADCGDSIGSITISNPSGGDGTFLYSIDGGLSTSPNATFSNLGAGQYSVEVTSPGIGCSYTELVTIGGTPAATITVGQDQSICEGVTATLTASGTGTVEWFEGVSSIGTGLSMPVTPLTNTTYSAVLTNSDGCTDTSQVLVTVNAAPVISASVDNNEICEGSTATLTATGGQTYSWDNGLGAGDTHNVSPSSITTYEVTGTDANGCSDTAQVTVLVNPLEDAGFNYSSSTFCIGGGNEIPTIVTGGGTFSSDPGLVFVDASTGEIDVSASSVGSYVISYTTVGTCPNSDADTISIINSPDASFTYSNVTYCQNDGMITPTFSGGSTAGTFSSTSGLSISPGNGEIDLSGSTPGVYTITNSIAATNSCPAVSETFSITINESPVVNAGQDMTVCDKESVTLTASTSVGTISWDNGVTDGVSFVPTLGTTTYTVTADNDGCTATDEVVITVEVCLDISKNELNLMTVFPNPASHQLTINGKVGITSTQLISLDGKIVLTNSISIDNQTVQIDVSSVEKGVYLLQIATEKGLVTKKVVIQ